MTLGRAAGLARHAGVVVAMAVTLLLLCEGAARLAGFVPSPEPYYATLWQPDAELGWSCKPLGSFRVLTPLGWAQGTTDEQGRRPTRHPGPQSVLCLGDSTTFCAGVDDAATWPEALAASLVDEQGGFRALNYGIGGYSALQSALALQQASRPAGLRAVIYLFCINDPAENFTERKLAPRLQANGNAVAFLRAAGGPPPPGHLRDVLRIGLRKRLALLAWTRQWRLDVSNEAYGRGARSAASVGAELALRLVREARLQQGMQHSLSPMQASAARMGVPLFVSAVDYPMWSPGVSQHEFAGLAGVSPETVAEQTRAYGAACRWLAEASTGVGARYLDCSGALAGMPLREFALAPEDWHLSGRANAGLAECLGHRLAQAWEKRTVRPAWRDSAAGHASSSASSRQLD